MSISDRLHLLLVSATLYTSLLLATSLCWSAETLQILNVVDFADWESTVFSGETVYSSATVAGRACVRAESRGTASGLLKKINVDLTKTPILHWDWYIQNTLGNIDETTKAGDDFAARVYVVVSGGIFFWKTRALSYVWANQKASGSTWPNPIMSNAIMVAVQSGVVNIGRWKHESRNVLSDIKNLLKLDTQFINAVAILTDTDNSASAATACYGEIYFASD